MNSELSARIREAAGRHVGPDGVAGLAALVLEDGDETVLTVGYLDTGQERPVAADSLFRIASTTKPITAAVALVLLGEGLFELDEPVARLLPELAEPRVLREPDGPLDDTVAAVRAITVRDLLTFTFGFGMAGEMFMSSEPWPVVAEERRLGVATIGPPNPEGKPDPDTWMELFARLPLLAQPGERWLYNTGATVLGVLLERAAQMPLGDVFRTRLFEPLGMNDTAFWTADTDRLATAYAPSPDGLVEWDPPTGKWSRPPSFCDAAAALVSTVGDLARFSRMLLDGGRAADGREIMREDLVAAMSADQLTAAQKARGGLGPGFFDRRSWGFCQAVYPSGAYGWDGGLGTSWRVNPAQRRAVVVLTQKLFETSVTPQVHGDIQAAAGLEV